MAKFYLNNNFFEFNSKSKEQIIETAIDAKLAPLYACTFTDKVETEF